MKITDVTATQMPTSREDGRGRFVIQVHTDDGLTGISEITYLAGVLRAYIDELVRPLIVGMDPLHTRRVWEALSFGIGENQTRLPPPVVGAIDVACWDIAGKAAGLPVHALLGGACRTEIPLYWSCGMGWRKTPQQMLEEVQEGYERGFRAFKVRMDWRDYRQDRNPANDLAIFQACREWLPDDVPLGFDANCGYSVPTAIEQGRRFEQLGIAHFEEPLPGHDLSGLRQVVDALDCAVSTGEQETSAWRFRDLIQLGNPDILQPDILIVGGLSELKRVFELAVLHNKVLMPHSPNIGATALASLHAYSTIANAIRPHEYSEEFTGPVEQVAELFIDPVVPEGGVIRLPDRPGLGLELDQKALNRAATA